VGWLYGADKLRRYINDVSDIKIGRWWNVLLRYVIPLCLLVLLVSGLVRDIKTPYEGYPQSAIFCFGWLVLIAIGLITFLFVYFSKE
ncbi:MAG: sodium-dependent transporter, partial [Candidatus Omnitrophota bacterium]